MLVNTLGNVTWILLEFNIGVDEIFVINVRRGFFLIRFAEGVQLRFTTCQEMNTRMLNSPHM